MYSVSHGKMKTTEPGTDLKAEGPLGVASLLVGAWAVPQRPNAWVFDSTCGKTLDELNKLVLSLPATIAPKPIARPRLDSDVEPVGQFLKNTFSGQSWASNWYWLKGRGKTLDELNKLVLSLPATIAPKPIARPRLDSDVEPVGQFLKNTFSGQSWASNWYWLKGRGKTLDELNKLVLSLPATIAPKPIARPRLDSDVEAVGQFLKSSFSGQSRASDWCWLKGCGETLSELDQLSQSLSASGVSISTARPLWRGPSGDEQARHQATIVSFEFPPRLFCTHFLYAKT